MIQLTLIRLNQYGKWTHTLGENREHMLQVYQAEFYKIIQKKFSSLGGIVFQNRQDELFAITNGIGVHTHQKIIAELELLFPFDILMFIGYGTTPFTANRAILNLIQSTAAKKGVFGNPGTQGQIYIIHSDIQGITKISNDISPYEVSNLVHKVYRLVSEFFMDKNSLTFFMGGDNFITVLGADAENSVPDLTHMIKEEMGLTLNCGMGTGISALEAVTMATTSLDAIRALRDVQLVSA